MTSTGPSCGLPRDRWCREVDGLWWPACWTGHVLQRRYRELGPRALDLRPEVWRHLLASGPITAPLHLIITPAE